MQGVAGLWTEGNLCDITLVADGKSIAAHRIILASVSPYFRRMFLGDFKESKQSEVHLEGIDYNALVIIIECIYSDELDFSTGSASDVLAAADFLQINTIVRVCELSMIDELSNETCFDYLKEFEKFNLEEGQLATMAYIIENFVPLSKTAGFLEIGKDALCSYLDHTDLTISEEIEAFRAAQAWIEHDAQRFNHCGEIMQYIRLAFIPVEKLNGEVRKAEFMQSNETCALLLSKALKYHENIYIQPSIKGTTSKPRMSASLFIIDEDKNHDRTRRNDEDEHANQDFKYNGARILAFGDKRCSLVKEFNVGVPLAWMGFNVVEFNSFLYVLGLDIGSFSMVNRRYDVNIDKWLDLEPMPSGPVRGCAAVRSRNTIVVTGGYALKEEANSSSSNYLTQSFLYDISTNIWKLGSGLPGSVSDPGIASLSNIVYAAEEGLHTGTERNRMWAYDLNGDVWLEKPDFPEIEGGIGCIMQAVDDKLILCHRHIDDPAHPKAAIFDVSQNQWSYSPLPTFVCLMSPKNSFVHESEMYIFMTDRSPEHLCGRVIKLNSRGEHVVLGVDH